MGVFFTSDLHLGHAAVARMRGFSTIEEHDNAVIGSFSGIAKKDKLFILGDVAWRPQALARLSEMRGYKELIFGNHDKLQLSEYRKHFQKLHGCRKYKEFFLTHIPIHPQELYRVKGNIHGHIHKGGATLPLEDSRYINVNWDFWQRPIPFEELDT